MNAPSHPSSVLRPPSPFAVFVAASAAERVDRASDAVRACEPGTPVLIVGASRGAADDLAREVAGFVPATFGLQRLSLTQLAARTAMAGLASRGVAPSSWLGAEAVATRALFGAAREGSLRYFQPVAGTPGFPRALARTLDELRLAGIRHEGLKSLPLTGRDLAALLERFETCFVSASVADRADLFRTAARLMQTAPVADVVILLDVQLDHAAERELVAALTARASTVLATVPHGDRETLAHFVAIGATVEAGATHPLPGVEPRRGPAEAEAKTDASLQGPDGARSTGSSDLACLRRFLFNTDVQPAERELDGSLQLFSAPGEGRECVEIARRILREARAGVRFDEIAVLVRAPQSYLGLLEHALRRADVPAWFDRGTRRPHPAGRAFLALLACAAEQLSAGRFAEYLSLGQVPILGEVASPTPPYVPSVDEVFGAAPETRVEDELEAEARESAQEPADGSVAVVAGTLRAPWRWEKLLVEAAVIGQDAARWKRRLDGKRAELRAQREEAARQDGDDSPRVRGAAQMLEQLEHLRGFALPIIDELASWPPQSTWGEWLDRFAALAPRVLRVPAQVLRVLADLRPMAEVGPVDLDEARRVLADRLLTLESEPPARRFGRVFVGTPQQVRGRSFRVVFVPGLAERMFPQKPREDPLLLDPLRTELDAGGATHASPAQLGGVSGFGSVSEEEPHSAPVLPTQPRRLAAERFLLQLAAGAASDRLYVSYPRIELTESRARVPSFYALDVMRAATGRVPHHEWLEDTARAAGNAMLAWPAPADPDEAIDDQEHDLAVLRRLLDEHDRDAVKGHAHYLLKLNECLRRSVIDRWARAEPRWSTSDGLVCVSPEAKGVLAGQRLTARAYSLSALQRFSACPYQFLLAATYRLQPLEQPEPLQRLDPLTRGSLFHEIQARFFRTLASRRLLPVTGSSVDAASGVLDEVVDASVARAYDELAPAVDRVWSDEVASLRRDLHGWFHLLARDGEEWTPRHFEFAFGSVPGERDPSSVREAVTLDDRFTLRGAIDLVEEHHQKHVLRVTDHKTGRKPDQIDNVIIGGGAVLQPVLYAMAVEAALGQRVSHGRLSYCTSAGGYSIHAIPLTDTTRAAALEALEVIDRAIEQGVLPAAPIEDACARCDYRPVCGSGVFRRVSRKPQERLADLAALRSRP